MKRLSLGELHHALGRPLPAVVSGCYRKLFQEVSRGAEGEEVVVCTADHAAPFNRIGSLTFALPAVARQVLYGEGYRVLLLPGSLIPCDNGLYPRGVFLSGEVRPPKRINFVTQRFEKSSPLLLPPVDASRFGPFEEDIRAGQFHSYADQLCAIMKKMVSSWVESSTPAKVDVQPVEAVANRMLVKLLEVGDPNVELLLFNGGVRRRLYEALKGTFCAWGERHGSFLFWGRGEQGRTRRLAYEDVVRGESAEAEYLRGPGQCLRALRDGALVPNVFLSLFLVSYLPQLPVSGGPMQWRYYRRMIRVCNDLLGLQRPHQLSRYGYMCYDPKKLASAAGRAISKFGPGMDLLSHPLKEEEAEAILQKIEIQRFRVPLPDYR